MPACDIFVPKVTVMVQKKKKKSQTKEACHFKQMTQRIGVPWCGF